MNMLKRIHLIDKFLLIFMLIFMLESAFSLFIDVAQSPETNTIDVIIRTSAAAIFGYFISANFVHRDSLKDTKLQGPAETKQETKVLEPTHTIKNQIGFTVPGEKTQTVLGRGTCPETKEQKEETAAGIQIVITATIGLIALCILLIYRNFFEMSQSSAGIVSQLRDFVSGCVGFLIGGTTSRGKTIN